MGRIEKFMEFEKFSSWRFVSRARTFNRYKIIDFPKPYPPVSIKIYRYNCIIMSAIYRQRPPPVDPNCPPQTYKTGVFVLKINTLKTKLFLILVLTFPFYLL